MPKFNMPSSSFSSGGQGFSGKRGQDLSTLMSHQNIGQFLDNIRHRVNKSMESGTKKLSFNAIITGTSFSSTVGDISTVSVSFQTTGAITSAI